ncbi:hypothetical protein PUN4_50055 [Paraburkholderia unamae]|nr:hypothetical protein PUN4_50055 [Paraburkholderia unamae]
MVDSARARCTASATTGVASDEKVLAIELDFDSDEPAGRWLTLKRVFGRGNSQSPSISIAASSRTRNVLCPDHTTANFVHRHCDALMKHLKVSRVSRYRFRIFPAFHFLY